MPVIIWLWCWIWPSARPESNEATTDHASESTNDRPGDDVRNRRRQAVSHPGDAHDLASHAGGESFFRDRASIAKHGIGNKPLRHRRVLLGAPPKLCLDRAGGQRGDSDTGIDKFFRQALAQREQIGLGGCVGAHPGHCLKAGSGGDVEDAPTSTPDHLRNKLAA